MSNLTCPRQTVSNTDEIHLMAEEIHVVCLYRQCLAPDLTDNQLAEHPLPDMASNMCLQSMAIFTIRNPSKM